jgi:hypothetical protein
MIPLGKRKTRPESAPAAIATIIGSGAIHGRNHAEPLDQGPAAIPSVKSLLRKNDA